MNRDQSYTLIRQTFTQSFDKTRFQNFAVNLLNRIDESKAKAWNSTYIKDAFKNHVSRYERLGTFTSPDNEKIDILIVHLTSETKLSRARTAIRNFVAHHLKTRDEKDAALVAFVSPTEKQWRFSYVKMEYATLEKESGKVGVETRLTPARRFSYIVGEGESCHTAQTRFLPLLQDTKTDPKLADIEEVFSVEAVTKEFFKHYVELFENIHQALEKFIKKDKSIGNEIQSRKVNTVDFAKKLMGQIVFLYFLQKKGWLGVAKGEDWGTGPHDFLRRLARGEYGAYENYFNDILEPLFYDTLANDRGHEAWCRHFKCRIPFLNGGLFEALGGYDWRKIDILLPNRLFTNNDPVEEGITGTGVLDVFDRYNFTVNEAEPLEKEVAIDPEMLGKVFENLIEENLRKGLGAYYTPREIVHYMCQKSLINYLDTALNKEKELILRKDIDTFIHLGEQYSFYEAAKKAGTIGKDYPKPPKSISEHAKIIDDKLIEITVCDPAVGSGAFPVGMMTEIVRARSALTPYFNDVHERTPYFFKRHAIQNCIYGVDIDHGAVEIAKLRLWLSLVVDEDDVKQVKPLPNLDYKVVTGNSLLGVEKNLFNNDLFIQLEKLKPQYFDETDAKKKAVLKRQIDDLIHNLTNGKETFDFGIYFSEVFHKREGFDIIIGNPPYLFTRDAGFTEEFKAYVRQNYFSLINASKRSRANQSGKINLFGLFILKGVLLNGHNGILTFIIPNNLLRTTTYNNIRKFILDRCKLLEIVDLGSGVFENVTASTVITTLQKCQDEPQRSTNKVSLITEITNIESRDYVMNKIQQSEFLTNVSYCFNLFVDNQVRSVINKLDNTKNKLGHYCDDIIEGIVAHKHLIDDVPKNQKYIPLIEGKCVKRYYILPAKKYLKWDRNQIHRTRPDYLWQADQKIIVQRISGGANPITAALDTDKSKTFASVNNILLKPRYKHYYKYILALLNSKLLNWYYANCFSNNSTLTVNISKTYLEQLPLMDLQEQMQKPLNGLVDRILTAKKRNSEADTKAIEREIDQLVYHLYGLTEDEIAIVEGG